MRRPVQRREKMRVFVYLQITYGSKTRAETHAGEYVQKRRLLLISQRLVIAQTGRPHAGDVRASLPRMSQGRAHLKAK